MVRRTGNRGQARQACVRSDDQGTTQARRSRVIIHKIDRSARNLKDWADLGELIDAGVEVHFANEGLDLTSRGGRLSADIQAVVASDFIRNLREETKKGFYGRLKQGILPMPAPVGYRDVGPGQPKELDPAMSPLVRHLFELYSSGQANFELLEEEAERIGLRGRSGNKITKNGLSTLLNNPFYTGIIRIVKTGQTFHGAHQPLITKALFDRVHDILEGKTNTHHSPRLPVPQASEVQAVRPYLDRRNAQGLHLLPLPDSRLPRNHDPRGSRGLSNA